MIHDFQYSNVSSMYSRTPLIRPPSESHWCGRIRGMVAREGFRYAALLQQRHTKYGRIRGMVVGEGGRSTGVLLYYLCLHRSNVHTICLILSSHIFLCLPCSNCLEMLLCVEQRPKPQELPCLYSLQDWLLREGGGCHVIDCMSQIFLPLWSLY